MTQFTSLNDSSPLPIHLSECFLIKERHTFYLDMINSNGERKLPRVIIDHIDWKIFLFFKNLTCVLKLNIVGFIVGGTVTLNSAAPMAQGCVYLSTDIFYIEIKMDPSGIVIDAKIMYSDAMCQSLQTSQALTFNNTELLIR